MDVSKVPASRRWACQGDETTLSTRGTISQSGQPRLAFSADGEDSIRSSAHFGQQIIRKAKERWQGLSELRLIRPVSGCRGWRRFKVRFGVDSAVVLS
jgi:hypothetical protein